MVQIPAPSLPESYRTIKISKTGSWFKKFLGFAGPGYLVSVGYMDPGNWATDLAGGSKFGYQLLWVILVSNLMAMLLQTLCARLGIVAGKDLAQACRDFYKKPASIALWILCEIAIVACDVAEVIGSAVALNLLFGMPLVYGVLLTGFDVMLLLALMKFGFRKIEAIIITLVATIFGCFAINMFLAKPSLPGIAQGLVTPSLLQGDALLIAVGILGATVMPHNLYLHSSIVQTRDFAADKKSVKEATKMATIDTIIALGAAFFVNAAILILAAAVFHGKMTVDDLGQAHEMLKPALGGMAATLFAVALLCSGQSSTITATLAGQIVMEGFLNIKVKPWVRRLITRGLALIPAVLLVTSTGSSKTVELLVYSQVVLSMQLPFAIFPLVMFTSDKRRMGEFANPVWLQVVAYAVCSIIAALNIKLLWDVAGTNLGPTNGPILLGSIALGMLIFGLWVRFLYKGKPLTAE